MKGLAMGRKKSDRPAEELHRISVDLVPALYTAIDDYCRERGLMRTEFCRIAIVELAERKGIFPVAPKA